MRRPAAFGPKGARAQMALFLSRASPAEFERLSVDSLAYRFAVDRAVIAAELYEATIRRRKGAA